jgi:ferritin-like metal-binding protein YciE
MQLNSLNDVFAAQIADLYSAERQLVEALPNVARGAHSDALRQAFEDHLVQTRGHVARLEEVLGQAGIMSPTERCEAMEGLIAEGKEILAATGDPAAKDAALIAAAQRIEHYEIAGYGTARALAGELGFDDAKSLLEQTLDEESDADKLLTKIATGGLFGTGVNQDAQTAGMAR